MNPDFPVWRRAALADAAGAVGLAAHELGGAMDCYAAAEYANLAAADAGLAARLTSPVKWGNRSLPRDAAHVRVLLLSRGVLAYDHDWFGDRRYGWYEVDVRENPYGSGMLALKTRRVFGPRVLRGETNLPDVQIIGGWGGETIKTWQATTDFRFVSDAAAAEFTGLQLAAVSTTALDGQISVGGSSWPRENADEILTTAPDIDTTSPAIFSAHQAPLLVDPADLPRAAISANLQVESWQDNPNRDTSLMRTTKAAVVLGRLRHGGIVRSWSHARAVLRAAHLEKERDVRALLGEAWGEIALMPGGERQGALDELREREGFALRRLRRAHEQRIAKMVSDEFGLTNARSFDLATEAAARRGEGWG